MDTKIEQIEGKLEIAKRDLKLWMVGAMVTVAGLALAAAKFFF